MKGARSLSGSLLSLVSIVGAVSLLASTIAPVSASSGDWSLVSAPPPPGPYRSVNLDPRVPGAEGIPMIGNAPVFSQPGESRVPVTRDAAPAAGRRAGYQAPRQHLPPQVPGRYQSRMPRPPVNTYPGPARYPANVGRQNYGTMPSRGYFPTHSYQAEQVVPPPPVYDAMMRSSPGANQGGTGR
jgi:hypothetical protein